MNPTPAQPGFTDMNALFHRFVALGMVRGAKVIVNIGESEKYGMRAMLGLEYKTFDQEPATKDGRLAVAADYLFHGLERKTLSYLASKATEAYAGFSQLARTRARLKQFELLCASPHDVMIFKDPGVIQALVEHGKDMQARPPSLLLEMLTVTEPYNSSFSIHTLAGRISAHSVERLVAGRTALAGDPVTEQAVQQLFERGPRAEWSGRGFAA